MGICLLYIIINSSEIYIFIISVRIHFVLIRMGLCGGGGGGEEKREIYDPLHDESVRHAIYISLLLNNNCFVFPYNIIIITTTHIHPGLPPPDIY